MNSTAPLLAFLARVRANEQISFQDTLAVIAEHYQYTPTRFRNGRQGDCVVNEAGSNEGSCRLFYFAKLHALTVEQTLSLFGEYYRQDVLAHPAGTDHANIRTFMRHGWAGINYDGEALKPRVESGQRS